MRTTDQQSHDDIDNRNAQEQKKLEEENIAALRDAAEAISISRAALEATLAQGEQLQHCDDINARNKYIVDKSARIVRGMTWSGWMMNAFSKDSKPPTNSKAKSEQASTGSRDDDNVNGTDGITSILTESEVATLPQHLQNFACMLQNYECNVLLLEKYKDTLEYDTCVEVCKQLYISTKKEMEDGKANTLACASRESGSIQLFRRLEKKLEEVHDLQYTIIIEERQHQQQLQKWTGREGTVLWKNKKVLRAKTITSDTGRALQHRIDKQDEHLDALAGNIQELLHNGVAIGTTLESQNQLLGKLESDTDDLTEHTKMVSRRADRLSHRSLWRKPKADLKYRVAIEHIATKRFLSIEPHNKNKLALHGSLHPDMSVFEVHERRESKLMGFKNICTGTWLGQSSLGSVLCSARVFGRNEEWELDDDIMTQTKLLCASANWGNGGWLEVDADGRRESFAIGNYDVEAKQKAAIWSILVLNNDG